MNLGALEADVLYVLKKFGKASARDVLVELRKGKDMAYTTVSTTLDRLYRKGLLGRETAVGKGGTKYLYTYPENPSLQKEIVTKTVDKLVSAFGSSVVSTIYERLNEVSNGEVEELRRKIDEKRRSTQ